MCTPVNANFAIKKWCVRGSPLHGPVRMMLFFFQRIKIPGLHDDRDHTAWFPTSLTFPSFSSLRTSRSGLAVNLVAMATYVKLLSSGI